MYADLDELVLSGRLFNGRSRSSSPARPPSPHREWPDTGGGEDDDASSDAERERRIARIISAAPQDAPAEAIGMRPGRTGVKGVIRDRAEAQARARGRRAQEVAEMNRRMEKASLGGKTFLEEERERELERMMLEGIPRDADTMDALRRAMGKGRAHFGHLREVGVKNFVSAVEMEERGVWVVVHLYDPSLDRCYALDTELSRLARLNDDVKFLRARASALGFASTAPASSTRLRPAPPPITRGRITAADDEDDPYAYGDEKDITDPGDSSGEDGDDGDENVDLDVLPTMLVYRDGELEHTWVRVDWEAGPAGVEELLLKHRILKSSGPGPGNCGLPSDDEDLWESDEDAP